MKKLVIYVCGTEGYTYAMTAQARRVQRCIFASEEAGEKYKVTVLLVGDGCAGQLRAMEEYKSLLPKADVECLVSKDLLPVGENYKNPIQLSIAQMRTCASNKAMAVNADYLWSLDSDVLPPANALRCMVDMLSFDNGYYGVAACPYPSQGGGAFLCGRGTPARPILPCSYEDEKDVPEELLSERGKLEKQVKKLIDSNAPPNKPLAEKLQKVNKDIEAVPPNGNVFVRNAEKWRKRGWFDNAYPAIGLGAVVPSDWCGFGCTLMNKMAISLCDWSGYDGGGTEDLYVVWQRWYPNNIRIAAIPHAPCDHVVRHREEKGKLVHIQSYHEGEGECVGHLRQKTRPWYSQDFGERYSPENDGDLYGNHEAKKLPKVKKPKQKKNNKT